jgi:hypothetical protein
MGCKLQMNLLEKLRYGSWAWMVALAIQQIDPVIAADSPKVHGPCTEATRP